MTKSNRNDGLSRRTLLKRLSGAGALALGVGVGPAGSATGTHVRSSGDGGPPTPPMGWNSWNTFHCDIDEQLIEETAEAMVDSGMRAAGYEYVVLDDCWMAHERAEDGSLVGNPDRFPGGMAALADVVHDRDLGFGLYQSAGTEPCASENGTYEAPGCLGHEYEDAETFASWGVDYLKYDNCGGHDGQSAWERFSRMSDALDATDRDVVYSQCSWGDYDEFQWAWRHGATLWRTTTDITNSWDEGHGECENAWFMGVTNIVDYQDCRDMHRYANWGHWNDPDMLEVGNPGLSATESRAHFGMWCMMAAPLIAGNDLRNMDQATVDVLTNEDVIAVDQDPAGVQGRKVRDDGQQEVWAKPLVDNEVAVALFNRATSAATISTTAADVGLPAAEEYRVRDLWADSEELTAGEISATVDGHGIEMFRVSAETGVEDLRPTEYLGDWHWMAAYNGWQSVQRDASVDGNPITLNGTTYETGLGTHAHSQVVYWLGGDYERFQATVGVDDEVNGDPANARFEVWADGDRIWQSSDLTPDSSTESVDVDVAGVDTLKLVTTPVDHSDDVEYDHTDWADARVTGGATPTPCEPTAITPYVRVDGGSWQNTSSVTVQSGTSVEFGPQPASGGSWSWSGPGLSASTREVTVSPSSDGTTTYTATYTNDCGETSTQSFTVTVESNYPTAPSAVDGTTPQDTDGDGVYEDFNGNGEFDSDDVVTYFQHIDDPAIQDNPSYYDANGNGNADFDDVVTLFQQL